MTAAIADAGMGQAMTGVHRLPAVGWGVFWSLAMAGATTLRPFASSQNQFSDRPGRHSFRN
jgi:hypothetical protein